MQRNQRNVDVVVFITDEDIRTDIEDGWREKIRREFGWELELRTVRWLAPVASQPQYESLVDDYLHIPPPDGDFTQTIETEFEARTVETIGLIEDRIPGLPAPLPRREIATIEEQIASGRAVLLTGSAGSGKSGIGAALAQDSRNEGKVVLFLDARSLAHIDSESGLRQYLGLRGNVRSALSRAGRHKGCRLIVDQLDNVVGLPIGDVLVTLAMQSFSQVDNVEVVVISRNQEPHESRLLGRLVNSGCIELLSSPLSEATVRSAFEQLGITNYSSDIIALGRNLLNLELIAKIHAEQSNYNFATLTSEVHLWEQYIEVLSTDEERTVGEHILAEAVGRARQALANPDGTFDLSYPPSRPAQRLISWAIIILIEGRVYRFRHERFQEFIYAWDATQRLAMPSQVLSEIAPYRSQSIFRWMNDIYQRSNSIVREQFLKEMFDVE